jgi:hypothetical protein
VAIAFDFAANAVEAGDHPGVDHFALELGEDAQHAEHCPAHINGRAARGPAQAASSGGFGCRSPAH